MKKFLEHGIKREIGFPHNPDGLVLEIGAGYTPFPEPADELLDYPGWDGDLEPIPYTDEYFAQIHMFHILEHLEDPIRILLECQRVLRSGGVLNIVVPYYSSQLAAMDLDHKHAFSEKTWKTLFNNQHYDKNKRGWKFKINVNLIYGIVERNICLYTQLEKI